VPPLPLSLAISPPIFAPDDVSIFTPLIASLPPPVFSFGLFFAAASFLQPLFTPPGFRRRLSSADVSPFHFIFDAFADAITPPLFDIFSVAACRQPLSPPASLRAATYSVFATPVTIARAPISAGLAEAATPLHYAIAIDRVFRPPLLS
jgi:hypothetical protein